MKSLAEQVKLTDLLETITITEFRSRPGEVLVQVMLGKTYIVTGKGTPVAVISKPPGVQLSTEIDSQGKSTFIL